jgi:hypothetical protein
MELPPALANELDLDGHKILEINQHLGRNGNGNGTKLPETFQSSYKPFAGTTSLTRASHSGNLACKSQGLHRLHFSPKLN